MESISWTSNSGWTKYEKIMDQNFEGKRSSFFHLVETLLIFSLYFSEYLGITFHFQTHFFRSTIVWVGHGHGLIGRDRGDPHGT